MHWINTYFFFIIVLGGGTSWYLHKFLQYIKYIILEFPPPSFSFIPSSPHSWNSFNRYHFSIYIHVYTVFALWIHAYFLLGRLYFFSPQLLLWCFAHSGNLVTVMCWKYIVEEKIWLQSILGQAASWILSFIHSLSKWIHSVDGILIWRLLV
jgi:hypothetical protein